MPLYPCMVPLLVVILADSLSVILLFTSFGLFAWPIRGLAVFRNLSILSNALPRVSADCAKRSARALLSALRLSSFLCSFRQRLICRCIFARFFVISSCVPDHSLAALY